MKNVDFLTFNYEVLTLKTKSTSTIVFYKYLRLPHCSKVSR